MLIRKNFPPLINNKVSVLYTSDVNKATSGKAKAKAKALRGKAKA